MIRNGHPYTNENGAVDDDLISSRPKEIQEKVFDWIYQSLIPRKTVLKDTTSYGLKHKLDNEIGIYLTNNEFKDAMMECGYEPCDPNELNWHYCLSKKSPIFIRERQRLLERAR